MSKPENPYMYPHVEPGNYEQFHGGISLRDWFAGQALSSVMGTATNLGESKPDDRRETFAMIAGFLYEMADAMLAERSKS